MAAMESSCSAADAEWKRIQEKTFTRWVNHQLKTVNVNVSNLKTEAEDGLYLIALAEVLSGKEIKRYNKRPRVHSQRLENVEKCLGFLIKDERIRFVNIGAGDIVEGNLKLILGLIWTLILHYSTWDEDEPISSEESPTAKPTTPKQRLVTWVQGKVLGLTINNFTSDWNDGRAVAALVDALGPGLCPDWKSWGSENALDNAQKAMNTAEEWLDIPQVLSPEDMVNPNIDELSMMTYLSLFTKAKLKPGAPVKL